MGERGGWAGGAGGWMMRRVGEKLGVVGGEGEGEESGG